MSNELKIIDSREVLGKEFKMYGDFDNPLFLAKDVAEWIENSNTSQMLGVVDEEEKALYTIYRVDGSTNKQWFLSEDGLYEVLMQSRKPIAKQFKKEVKIILKSVRKHGAYMTEDTLEKAITNPDFLIKLATELKNEQEQRRELEAKIKTDKPFTLLGNAVSGSQGSILVRELSKLLNQNGIDTGEKRLYSWLIDNEVPKRTKARNSKFLLTDEVIRKAEASLLDSEKESEVEEEKTVEKDNDLVSHLVIQLEVKDTQIVKQQEQIDHLQRLLENQQILTLKAQEKVELLEGGNFATLEKEEIIEEKEPEEKLSFWKRLFR